MFLTTPKYILKPSSSAPVSKPFFPPLPASPFKFNNGDQTLTQSDSLFSLLNYFYLISTCGNLHAMTSAPPFSFPALPLLPRCYCFQVLRVLDPPCTYSPTLNITSARWSFTCLLRDPLGPGHAGSGLSRDKLPPSRPKHGCLRLGRNRRELSTPLR